MPSATVKETYAAAADHGRDDLENRRPPPPSRPSEERLTRPIVCPSG